MCPTLHGGCQHPPHSTDVYEQRATSHNRSSLRTALSFTVSSPNISGFVTNNISKYTVQDPMVDRQSKACIRANPEHLVMPGSGLQEAMAVAPQAGSDITILEGKKHETLTLYLPSEQAQYTRKQSSRTKVLH